MCHPLAVLPIEPYLLSPIDQLFIGHSFSCVLRYEARLDEERLAGALATVVEGIAPLACRLTELEDARWGLVSSKSVPRWLEVREVPGLPEELSDPSVLDELVPRLSAAPGQPLLAIRLTRAHSGSILGVTVAHGVADGYSLFLLLRAWSRAVLGRPVEPLPWDRQLLAVETSTSAAALSPEDVWRDTGFSWCETRRVLDTPQPASFGTRLVPPEPRSLAEGQLLSDNDLLCAWLIKTRGGALAGPAGLAVTIPVDYRRSHGALPNNYFGNAVRFAPLWLDRETLERETLPELAARVAEAVRRVIDARGARASLECLTQLFQQRGGRVLEALHVVDPRAGLLVTNVSRLPFGTLDYGGGPPARVLLPAVEERTAVIQQTDDGFELSLNAPA
jgi:transferase family protein